MDGKRSLWILSARFGLQHHGVPKMPSRMDFPTARRRAQACGFQTFGPAGIIAGFGQQHIRFIFTGSGRYLPLRRPKPPPQPELSGTDNSAKNQPPQRHSQRPVNFKRHRPGAYLSRTIVRECQRSFSFHFPVEAIGATTAQVIIFAFASDAFYPKR